MSDKTKEPSKISDIKELHPVAQKIATELIDNLKKQGIDARVIETYRTQERQNYLYSHGRTRKGNIVTKTKDSVHTKRKAFDVGIFDEKGNYIGTPDAYMPIGNTLNQLNLRQRTKWGGDWGWDFGHIELDDKIRDIVKE